MNILLKYGKNASSNKVNWGPEALGNPVFRPRTAVWEPAPSRGLSPFPSALGSLSSAFWCKSGRHLAQRGREALGAWVPCQGWSGPLIYFPLPPFSPSLLPLAPAGNKPGSRFCLIKQGILGLTLGLAFHSSMIKLHFSVVLPLNSNPFKEKFKESKTQETVPNANNIFQLFGEWAALETTNSHLCKGYLSFLLYCSVTEAWLQTMVRVVLSCFLVFFFFVSENS